MATAVIDSGSGSVRWVCCRPSFPAGELEMVHEIGGSIVHIVDCEAPTTQTQSKFLLGNLRMAEAHAELQEVFQVRSMDCDGFSDELADMFIDEIEC